MAAHPIHCPRLPWMVEFFSTNNGRVPNNQLKAAYAHSSLKHLRDLDFHSIPSKKRLTSIMCTIGPRSSDVHTLEQLIDEGMCIARLKMPFYTKTECEDVIGRIRFACDNYSRKMGSMFPVAIAMDLKGPEIRTGVLKDSYLSEIQLVEGNETNITTDPAYEEHVTPDMIYVDYQKINEIIEPGDKFYIDNEVTLSAIEIVGSVIRCLIERAGRISDRASVTLDNAILELPSISEVEIEFAKEQNVDIILVSSVKEASQIVDVKNILGAEGLPIMIISKIEENMGVKNIDAIIKESDGILISRSDLAVELPLQKLFLIQKSIIAACNKAGKPVIVAPQMLETMSISPIPQRSELMDVSNTILDGGDCIMLSRETASGDYPLETVRMLSKICREAEAAVYQRQVFGELIYEMFTPIEPIYALAVSVVEASLKTASAAIILLTTSGRTAKVISQYRPRCPIVALTRHARVARQLKIYRAVEPIHFVAKPLPDWNNDVKRRIQFGITYGKYNKFIRAGDTIVVVTGSRQGTGFTNCMNIFYASDFDTVEDETEKPDKVQKIASPF